MRHAVSGRKLSRDINSRKALLRNLASTLFVNGHLKTTVAKAKFVQAFCEKLISDAKKNNLSKNRALASVLTYEAFTKLTKEIGKGFSDRPGGYTRIIKLTNRKGDDSPMARLELLAIEKTQNKEEKSKEVKPKEKSENVKKETKKTTEKVKNEKP